MFCTGDSTLHHLNNVSTVWRITGGPRQTNYLKPSESHLGDDAPLARFSTNKWVWSSDVPEFSWMSEVHHHQASQKSPGHLPARVEDGMFLQPMWMIRRRLVKLEGLQTLTNTPYVSSSNAERCSNPEKIHFFIWQRETACFQFIHRGHCAAVG